MKDGRVVWPNEAKIAVSLVVNVEEGSELSIAEGDRGPEMVDELNIALKKPIRNYGNESNYQYGIKAGAGRVLGLLERYGVTTTFTAAALALERAPEVTKRIVAGGHEVCAHGYRWIHQFALKEQEEREFIRKAVASIKATTGERPVGWLSRYLHTDNTRRLLGEEGFLYHMDDYSDDLPFWGEAGDKPIIIVPYALDTNDMKFWLSPALTPEHWLDYAIQSFEWLYSEGVSGNPKMMSLGVHLRIIGRPGRIGALDGFLKHITSKPDVWITTRKRVAETFAEQNPFPMKT